MPIRSEFIAARERTIDLFCHNRGCTRYLKPTPVFATKEGKPKLAGKFDRYPRCYVCEQPLAERTEAVAP